MNTEVFVMAAGDQERWGSDVPKQHTRIWGERLIDRTGRMVMARGHTPTVVTHRQDLFTWRWKFVIPVARRWLCESVLSTHSYWGFGRVVVLLGDVIYSEQLMDLIFANQEPCCVFGRSHEIYAVTFDSTDDRVELALRQAVAHAEAGGGQAKLWVFYRAYSGIDLSQHVILADGIYRFVDPADFSRDFDYLPQVGEFLEAHPNE